MWRVTTISAVMLLSASSLFGSEILFESATMGPVVDSPYKNPLINDWVFLGVRFTLDAPVHVDHVGGHVMNKFEGGTSFAAIVPLEADGFPIDPVGDQAPRLDMVSLAHGLFSAPADYSAEVLVELDVVLQPGIYGLVFGGGLFGASNLDSVLIDNGVDIGSPEYFFWRDDPADGFWQDPRATGLRFVVTGTVVPEPGSLVLLLLGSLSLLRRQVLFEAP